jgi:hypothetical protein
MADELMKRGGMSDSGYGEPPNRRRTVPYGGDIPSPQQMTPEQARMKSMSAAQLQAMMDAMQMRTPDGMQSDMGSTVPGEGMNRPAMDINDAVFGPDRKRFDIVEFITNLIGGGR